MKVPLDEDRYDDDGTPPLVTVELPYLSLGSPGIDSLRWTRPVYPGDTLRVRLEVLEARPMGSRPDVGLVRQRWQVLNQQREVVMTMEGWGMFRRRWSMSKACCLGCWRKGGCCLGCCLGCCSPGWSG